jgi:hypothetical protein
MKVRKALWFDVLAVLMAAAIVLLPRFGVTSSAGQQTSADKMTPSKAPAKSTPTQSKPKKKLLDTPPLPLDQCLEACQNGVTDFDVDAFMANEANDPPICIKGGDATSMASFHHSKHNIQIISVDNPHGPANHPFKHQPPTKKGKGTTLGHFMNKVPAGVCYQFNATIAVELSHNEGTDAKKDSKSFDPHIFVLPPDGLNRR